MQSTINERLKIIVEALGTNQNALAVMLGLSPSTFRNYTDRESKPGYEVLEKLYHSFKHINLYWLFGEPGEPLLGDGNSGVNESGLTYQSQAQNQKKNRGHITNHNNSGPTTYSIVDCERERDRLWNICQSHEKEIELLRKIIDDKDLIIKLYQSQQSK